MLLIVIIKLSLVITQLKLIDKINQEDSILTYLQRTFTRQKKFTYSNLKNIIKTDKLAVLSGDKDS